MHPEMGRNVMSLLQGKTHERTSIAIGLPGFCPSVEPRAAAAGLSALGPDGCVVQPGTLADKRRSDTPIAPLVGARSQCLCHGHRHEEDRHLQRLVRQARRNTGGGGDTPHRNEAEVKAQARCRCTPDRLLESSEPVMRVASSARRATKTRAGCDVSRRPARRRQSSRQGKRCLPGSSERQTASQAKGPARAVPSRRTRSPE